MKHLKWIVIVLGFFSGVNLACGINTCINLISESTNFAPLSVFSACVSFFAASYCGVAAYAQYKLYREIKER